MIPLELLDQAVTESWQTPQYLAGRELLVVVGRCMVAGTMEQWDCVQAD